MEVGILPKMFIALQKWISNIFIIFMILYFNKHFVDEILVSE